MKKIVKFAMVMVVAAVVTACTKPDNNGLVFLDVTPNNISGVWRMDSYDNGVKLPEGCYYIVFDRTERTFVTYDNLGSMEAYKNSGRYDIVTDGAAVIRGIYDYGRGDWEHEYYVRNLTSDSMVWVATDDESVKQVYVRASLPEELANDEE